jgi:hypothetical protein
VTSLCWASIPEFEIIAESINNGNAIFLMLFGIMLKTVRQI